MTLRFLASGAFLQVIGDTFGVDVATVSRVVTEVTDCLFRLKDVVIRCPVSDADRRRVMTGCIDRTAYVTGATDLWLFMPKTLFFFARFARDSF